MHRLVCNTLTVEDRLRTLAHALPDGPAVTLPVSLIRSWLTQSGSADPERAVDRTVAEGRLTTQSVATDRADVDPSGGSACLQATGERVSRDEGCP